METDGHGGGGGNHVEAHLATGSSILPSPPPTLSPDETTALRALITAITPPDASPDWLAGSDAKDLTQSMHPCEAEGWESRRKSHAIGARLCFGWVCASVLAVHVAWLEKRRMYGPASYVLQMLLRTPFLPRRRGQWWIRLCIDRDHLGAGHKADADLLLAALADPHLAAADIVDLSRRARKLGSAIPHAQRHLLPPPIPEPLTVTVGARRLRHGGGGRVVYVALEDGPSQGGDATCTVEQLVLQEYRHNGGWKGLHVETGIHCTLFALLMWDLLFEHPPPGAFTSRFQDAPHDLALDGGEFAAARQPMLEQRLDALRQMSGQQVADEVLSVHARQQGVRCRGLSWQRWGDAADELAEIAGCVPFRGWRSNV